jgi:N-methylhydantoinase B
MPKDGTIWVYVETMGGGAGARPSKDGLDGVHVHVTNTSNLPVEALELEYPLTLLRYEMVDGSGGAGKFRGGMGLRRVYRAEADCRVRVDVSRLRSQSWGLYGGLPGTHGQMVPGPGVKFVRDAAELKAGDWFEVVTPGAGGYGPPAERDRAAIARDLAEGVIDAKTARDIYGFNP